MKKKKSTVFLIEKFDEEFERDANFNIHGRKLTSLLEGFAKPYVERNSILENEAELLHKEHQMLESASQNAIAVNKKFAEANDKLNIAFDQEKEKNERLSHKYRNVCECKTRVIRKYFKIRMLTILFAALFIISFATVIFLYVMR